MSIQSLGSSPVVPGAQQPMRPKSLTNSQPAPSAPSQSSQPITPQSGSLGSVINEKA